jgi:signal peptidase I
VFAPIGSGQRAIKRVVGLPGDRILIGQPTIAVNARTIPIAGAPDEGAARPRTERVPAGALFLWGDNPLNSIDSRAWVRSRRRRSSDASSSHYRSG